MTNPKHHWFRWSLRTMFATVAALAVGLGMLKGYHLFKTHQEAADLRRRLAEGKRVGDSQRGLIGDAEFDRLKAEGQHRVITQAPVGSPVTVILLRERELPSPQVWDEMLKARQRRFDPFDSAPQ
jgi:hypothetical protein